MKDRREGSFTLFIAYVNVTMNTHWVQHTNGASILFGPWVVGGGSGG